MGRCIMSFLICIKTSSLAYSIIKRLQTILNAMLELDKRIFISLFAFFIFKRLGTCFTEQNYLGLNCITDEIENELDIYIKMLVILYADDTVLFADSAVEMQIQLDNYS